MITCSSGRCLERRLSILKPGRRDPACSITVTLRLEVFVSANAGFSDISDSATLGTIRYLGLYDLWCVIHWVTCFRSDDPGPMSCLHFRCGVCSGKLVVVACWQGFSNGLYWDYFVRSHLTIMKVGSINAVSGTSRVGNIIDNRMCYYL